MKRSEMVNRYRNDEELDSLLNQISEGGDMTIHEKLYKRCLEIALEAHMVAPAYIPKGESIWDSLCEWESEDEEK